MLNQIKFALLIATIPFFVSCSSHNEALKTLPNELNQLNLDCKRDSINFEMDCYDFVAHKNSFAQLRLGIAAQDKGFVQEAFQRYTTAQKMGNFYANALLSNLYGNGLGVEFDEKKSINLLKDVEDIDPIAAYKLSYYYFMKNDAKKAIELLEYAASNGVKDAQKELVLVYSNNQYIEENLEKSMFYDSMYQNNEEDFMKKIYGK